MDKSKHTFTVAEFKKTYSFEKKVVKTEICFCAYTVFQLYCNNNCVATGPVCEGGDFIANDKQPQNFFYSYTEITPNSAELCFVARVQMMPTQIYHFSKGHGGFALYAVVTYEEGYC